MILAVGFLLIVSLVTSAMLAAVGRRLDPVFGGWQTVVEVGNAIGGFVLVAFMFGLIYKVMGWATYHIKLNQPPKRGSGSPRVPISCIANKDPARG